MVKTSKKSVRVLVLSNADKTNLPDKYVKCLEEFIPVPPACNLDTLLVFNTSLCDEVINEIDSFKPDVIFHYGFENGNFWDPSFDEITVLNNKYSIISNNDSITSLFSAAYTINDLFTDKFKPKIHAIDMIKNMPAGLKIARTQEDLDYILNRCNTTAFGFDTETNFLNPFLRSPAPKLVCFSIAWVDNEEEGWCIPTNDKLILSGKCEFTELLLIHSKFVGL